MILPGTGRGTGPERHGGGGGSLRKPGVYTARKLRRDMSPPEVILWGQLRGSKLGFKVRRQHPIGPYVTDFFVNASNLVIEIDGSFHDFGNRPDRDAARDRYLEERGYRVVRIISQDVMKNLEGVVSYVAEQAKSPLHQPTAGPPPQIGEEL